MTCDRPFYALAVGILPFAILAMATAGLAQSQTSDEDVARRQLESGRAFARQGNYAEALKDFRAVADNHASSSVADDALLEIARYYLDVAGDTKEAAAAVDGILKKYATSNSAPEAYVMAGRLALARGRLAADLDAALANFDRVPRLFPNSDAVPRALSLAGDTLWYAGRFGDALANLGRVEVEYPASAAAASAYLGEGKALVSLGDPISAMEELQLVRNLWPNTPAAAIALARTTLLHRLYVRARGGPAFALAPDTLGPAKLEGVLSVTATSRNAVYWANDSGIGIATPANAEKPPAAAKPRGLTVDTNGNLVGIDGGVLRLPGGTTVGLLVPRPNGSQETLTRIEAVAQLSNGDWLVMDGSEKAIQRFTRAGAYVGPFASGRVSRLAVDPFDEVAGLDRDQKGVLLFDATGKSLGRIPAKGTGYDLQNPMDLTYDAFGHLYVLDRIAIAVFSPYPAAPDAVAPAATPPAAAASRAAAYRLVTLFAEPEKSSSGFHKATAFAVDQSGAVYLFDDRAQRMMVYR
jgi:TolA-binding protein